MNEAEELKALRRLAELEDKAAGVTTAKPKPDKTMTENIVMGGLRGVKDVIDTGAELLATGYDKLTGGDKKDLSYLVTGQQPGEGARIRAMNDAGKKDFKTDYGDSTAASLSRIGGNVLATWPVGGVLGKGAQMVGLNRLGSSLASGGFSTGAKVASGFTPQAANLMLRATGGAITGGASAGLAEGSLEAAGKGAMIGGALPVAAKVVGEGARWAGAAMRGKAPAPEVAALAQRAQELGINIPADRLADSRPMNAMAAGLNYVPFSGRAATEDAMSSQLNKAVSKTFGQDSSNVTQALRKADQVLGGQFETTLSQNGVKFDRQLLDDLAAVHNRAEAELGADALKPIANKINELVAKGENGMIDGRAAYNIKRDLDRLGGGNTPGAWHAIELKKRLMEALNRSLGPEKAAAFELTRKQYGNMLDLQKLATNGVDGEISAARLANMKNIGNDQVQELADIAAQFVKPREGQHGAAQRAFAGAAGLSLGGPAGLAAGAATGRGLNMLLNSNAARNAALGQPMAAIPNRLIDPLLMGASRVAPVAGSQ